jgi:MbtH protein
MKTFLACAALGLLVLAPAANASDLSSTTRIAADDREDETTFVVVKNHEGQYSIWPEGRELALGWEEAGFSGSKAECLAWIRQHR